MARTGIYPGSFDPVTNGHIDIITRAAAILDTLVVAVGVHHGKKPFFPADERIAMLKEQVEPIAARTGTEIVVRTFDNLTVEAAADVGATVMIRGLRDASDLDYEMQLAGMNREMAPGIETVFLAASPNVRHIAGTLVRQIASMGGDPGPFVPGPVAAALKARNGGGS
jgi:pantetheine-phosphate adenylyltransferase